MTGTDIQHILKKLQQPSCYLGNEINAIFKNRENIILRFALVFPDLYEIGTSHFGMQILYHVLNSHPQIYAERLYAPARDLMKLMEKERLQPFSLETKTSLKKFDIIGFSLLYELNYTNILHILKLSNIAFRSADRDEKQPLIIAGGPCTCNPEPIARFFDAIAIGDGEDLVIKMAEEYIQWKQGGAKSRRELLEKWSLLEGVYIPSYYKVSYENSHQILEPRYGFPKRIKRTVVRRLDKNHFPDAPIVPFGKPVHDRLRLEISRGCTRGCRFCQAGMIYRPVRERSPEELIDLALTSLQNTGYEDISLLSLSTGDYGCLYELIKALISIGKSRHLSVSLPSVRAGTLSPDLMKKIREIRKTGFTIAPEAGSQRLRNVINKNINYNDVQETVMQAFELGWQVIKLYFMIGLPTEKDKDIEELIEMVKRIKKETPSKRRGGQLNVSVATFIPKPHTPFQWHGQISLKESKNKISWIRNELKANKIKVKWQQPEMSVLEGLWARGDRRLSELLVKAVELDCAFDGWSNSFDFDKWKSAIDEAGIDLQFFTERQRDVDEPLPWDHIDVGVSKDYLIQEWNKALKGKTTPDCRWDGCTQCGVCDFKTIKPALFPQGSAIELHSGYDTKDQEAWLMFRFKKTGYARFLGHLEMSRAFIRAFRRTGNNIVYGKGYHPMPKIVFRDALPLGMESVDEVGFIKFKSKVNPEKLKSAVNQYLPKGLEIIECSHIVNPKNVQFEAVEYKVSLKAKPFSQELIDAFENSHTWMIKKAGKKGSTRVIDLKEMIERLKPVSEKSVLMKIRNKHDNNIRPKEVLINLFNITPEELEDVRVLKTKSLMEK